MKTNSFRPLTGMVLNFIILSDFAICFRPLTGMVLKGTQEQWDMAVFSPPYGENPLSHGLRRASSPERGSLVQGKWQLQKLSLRESWRAAPERVLRGEVEVWYKDFDGMAKKFLSPYGDRTKCPLSPKSPLSFRPLTGMVHTCLTKTSISCSFRPLTGMVQCTLGGTKS